MDMFSFNHEVTGPWHFDTSACFEEDNQSPVAFDLEGKGTVIFIDSPQLNVSPAAICSQILGLKKRSGSLHYWTLLAVQSENLYNLCKHDMILNLEKCN